MDWTILFSFILPLAYLYCLGDIVKGMADKRGRNGWLWALLAAIAGIAGAFAGFLVAPLLVNQIADPAKAGRLVLLCLWLPGVLASTLVGGIPAILKPASFVGVRKPAKTFRAGDWYKDATCTACGFLVEKDDRLCECDRCATQVHVTCWEQAGGCPKCDAAVAGIETG